ncbi:MAG: tetratricopeptide repeat protein [Armatimonadetes bacterium]|nr:tetratricopeptide repeat protein [Armatimonadota bacterium]
MTSDQLEQAVALKQSGKYEEALKILTELLVENPDWAEVRHQMGLVQYFSGMFDESLATLKHARDLAPDAVEIRNDLGLTYATLGMYDEARAEFNEVLSVDPSNAKAQEQLQYFVDLA